MCQRDLLHKPVPGVPLQSKTLHPCLPWLYLHDLHMADSCNQPKLCSCSKESSSTMARVPFYMLLQPTWCIAQVHDCFPCLQAVFPKWENASHRKRQGPKSAGHASSCSKGGTWGLAACLPRRQSRLCRHHGSIQMGHRQNRLRQHTIRTTVSCSCKASI